MQESPRFSEIIREFEQLSVSALFVAAHGRPPTIEEMAQVSEFVEKEFQPISLTDLLEDLRTMDDYEYHVDEPTTFSTPVAVKTKPMVNKQRVYQRRSVADINWKTKKAKLFLEVALDGDPQVFTYEEIVSLLPNFHKATREAFSNYLRKYARKLGYKTCHVHHNKRKGVATIHAIKDTTN